MNTNNTKNTLKIIDPCLFREKNNGIPALLLQKPVKEVFKNKAFCYYTIRETFEKIWKNNRIWINNVSSMDDKLEFKNVPEEKKNSCFLFCLCASDEENIPLWYLYGGRDGKGIRIRFTPGAIKTIITDGNFKVIGVSGKSSVKLEKGKDYEVECGYIYYQYSIDYYQYRNDKYKLNTNPSEFLDDNLFIKTKHWKFENEFRIVFNIINGQTYNHLELVFDNIFEAKKTKFMYGPETHQEEITMGETFEKSQLNVVMKK